MMRGLPSLCSLILLTFPLIANAGKLVYPVFPLTKEPVLDGRIKDDPAWKEVPFATGFSRFQSNDPASKQTSFGMGYLPGKALYVAFICTEPEMQKLKTVSRDGDVEIGNEDSIEIFLFPKGADIYHQFMISAGGSRWNGKGLGIPSFPLRDWEATAYRGERFYSVEVKIPFDALGGAPQPNEMWRGNFCRDILTGPSQDRYTRWGTGAFHDPESFVTLTFGREAFVNEVRRLTDEIGKSQKEFDKLAGSVFYQEEILPHLEQWKKMEDKTAKLDKLSALNLWDVYSRLGSYEGVVDSLKAEVLRQSLFVE